MAKPQTAKIATRKPSFIMIRRRALFWHTVVVSSLRNIGTEGRFNKVALTSAIGCGFFIDTGRKKAT
jgi:hypothetical protein